MAKLTFQCTECESHRLEAVETGITTISEINSIEDNGMITYGEQTNEGGECRVERYQCRECGWGIPNVHSEEELVEWLENNKPTKIRITPDYRNDTEHGQYQFVTGYTGGFAAPECVHLTFDEIAKRMREQHGDGWLEDDGKDLIWHVNEG